MNTDFCFEIYRSRLGRFKLIYENKAVLLKNSICYNNKKPITINDIKKFEILILTRFYSRSMSFFNVIMTDFRNGRKVRIEVKTLADQIKITTTEFELEDEFVNNLIYSYFSEDLFEDEVSLDVFFRYFDENVYEMKILAYEFVEITHNTITGIYNWILGKTNQYWDLIDFIKEGIVYLKNFEKLMLILVKDSENKWKITEYFS